MRIGGEFRSASFGTTPNMVSWYDAMDKTSLFQDSAGTTPVVVTTDPVGYWGDRMKTTNLLQATSGRRPTYVQNAYYGKPGVLFDGIDDFVRGAFPGTQAQPYTVFLVAQSLVVSGGSKVLIAGSSSGNPIFRSSSSVWQLNLTTSAVADTADTMPHIHVLTFDGTSCNYYRDGLEITLTGSIATTGLTGVTLASQGGGTGASFSNAIVNEAAVIGRRITRDERLYLTERLQNKWFF